MRLIVLGPPGAGKGTQTQILCKKFALQQISTGDMLRKAVEKKNEFGNHLREVMESGALVSDEIINKLVKIRVAQEDCANGFIFDGFPRTVSQAESMISAGISIDHVLEIQLADEVIIKRMAGRRIHPQSGRIYHIEYNPPITEGRDDVTDELLIQREDDSEAIVRERLRVYHQQTKPLITFFFNIASSNDGIARYDSIDGSGSVEEIHRKLVATLQSDRSTLD